MKKIYKMLFAIACSILVLSLCGCSKFSSKKADSDTEEQEETQEIDTSFVANTNISYSAGSDSDWSYGNQRKEFPKNDACYARISSTVGAEKKKGIGTEIEITYKFTGAKNCKIELSDGIANKTESGDPDVVIFTRTVNAEKAKKEKESIVIFQYNPNNNATSVVLEVSYDDHVPAKYDVRNTIYFSEDTGAKEETETSK